MQRQIRPCLYYPSLICIVCCVIIALATSPVRAGVKRSESVLTSAGLSERQFEDEVKEYLGTPYRKGGTSKRGMDCSGFARTVYENILGVDLPHSSGDQFRDPDLKKIEISDLRTGDLVFFTNAKKKRINHVGVYLSKGQFIHASSSEGIIVSSLGESYWKKRFAGSKRPVTVSAVEESDTTRLDSVLATPVHDSAMISLNSYNTISTKQRPDDDFEAMRLRDPLVFGDDVTTGLHSLNYKQAISADLNVTLSTHLEKLDISNAWPGLQQNVLGVANDRDLSDRSIIMRQGLTLSSDYRLTEWMLLTPSLTYFDYNGDIDNLSNVPKRTFGLNAQMASQGSPWSLSMLIRYSDNDNVTGQSSADNKVSSLDMGVKIGYAFSQNLQMSLISKHDKRSLALQSGDDSATGQEYANDIAMVFDFSY